MTKLSPIPAAVEAVREYISNLVHLLAKHPPGC